MLNHLAYVGLNQYYFSICCRGADSTTFRWDAFLKNGRAKKWNYFVFLFIAKTSWGCKIIFIECKTRCARSTEALARLSSSFNPNKNVSRKWNDPALQKNVTLSHELVQCLHHAGFCDIDEVLFLVGIRHATTVEGHVVKHDNTTKSSQKWFLKVACNHSLNRAHDNANHAPGNLECLLKAVTSAELECIKVEIQMHQMEKMAMTYHFLLANMSFQGQPQNWTWKREVATLLLKF